MAKLRLAETTRGRGKIKWDTRGLAEGSIIVSGPFSVFLFPGIFRCADWPGCESAPARSFEFHSLPARSPSWDYSSENETVAHRDRTRFVRPSHNRADPSESQAWHSPRPYQGLPPVICRHEVWRLTQFRALPAACKRGRHRLPPRSGATPRATDFHNRSVANQKHHRSDIRCAPARASVYSAKLCLWPGRGDVSHPVLTDKGADRNRRNPSAFSRFVHARSVFREPAGARSDSGWYKYEGRVFGGTASIPANAPLCRRHAEFRRARRQAAAPPWWQDQLPLRCARRGVRRHRLLLAKERHGRVARDHSARKRDWR